MVPPVEIEAEQETEEQIARVEPWFASTETLLAQAEDRLRFREIGGALAAFHRAEMQGAPPDRCAAGRWMAHMFAGEFEQAWRESDAIRMRGAPDRHRFWQGEDLTGKRVVLRCLHGLGDAIQMLRFVPRLRERCASLTVEVPPAMCELAPCVHGMPEWFTWGEQAPSEPPAFDVQIEVTELPYLFRVTEADLPHAVPYVRAVPEVAACVERRWPRSPLPQIGLVWAASDWDRSRSLPFACAQRLAAAHGAVFWNMQGGAEHGRGAQIAGIRDARMCGSGLANYAAVLSRLDLLITVDTMAAHLAGAMCKPAWLLLQAQADWRWMLEREDSPWYPSLRLWRQREQGNWEDLLERVEASLSQWIQDCRPAMREELR